ncbi:WD repeat-containing protein 81 isoform X1 [Nematostella vectensis]|uniref:WD repeat-containing protein 81 isoform X1 n=1 Tax=Nematostella vectensis TaxID=45351 RepID=UPI0020777026|nr:WD repeat-containing protein 81 isoform X1 [Nematostella vectensis]
MGMNQKANELTRLVSKSLGLESSCIRVCSVSRVSCLVHEGWLHSVISGSSTGDEGRLYSHPGSEYERQLLLQPSHAGPNPPWLRVSIKVVLKSENAQFFPWESRHREPKSRSLSTVADLIQELSEESFQHTWGVALSSHPLALSYLPHPKWRKQDNQNVIHQIISDVFGVPVISLQKHSTLSNTKPNGYLRDLHGNETHAPSDSNLIPLVCALECRDAYFLVEPFFAYGLHDIFTFSPAVMSHSTIRLLFIIYQILHALQWYHENNLPFGNLALGNIRISKGLLLYLTTPTFKEVLGDVLFKGEETLPGRDCEDGHSLIGSTMDMADERITLKMPVSQDLLSSQESTVLDSLTDPNVLTHDLATLVDMWVRDEITNFDYLMALNYHSGRRLGDPNYHPLFPWVVDFTEECGGFRDLSKTKFRLNKGDHQLDMMYKQSWFESHEGGNSETVPHHVSDVLSEITYHAYLARRTPVSVLCEHLRSNWVPNEYPASMKRLFEWTPDECIPQFFTDPSIFSSIHDDLPDLALPPWTPTPTDFISWHRNALESDEVSRELHNWIDLTFGYKLSGKAAIKAKNVCLDLVSKSQSVSNFGVVQLFTQPHPPQSTCCAMLDPTSFSCTPLYHQHGNCLIDQNPLLRHLKEHLDDSMGSLDSIDEGGLDADMLQGKRADPSDAPPRDTVPLVNTFSALMGPRESALVEPEAAVDVIYLPDDYKPLEMLEKYEAIQKFKRQFPAKKYSSDDSKRNILSREALLKHLMQKDLEALGCLIVEIVLNEKVRLATAGLSEKEKARTIRDMALENGKLLPRFVRNGVLRLLNSADDKHGSVHQDADDDNDSDDSIPPLSARHLLHPQTGLFPFPEHFKEIHAFVVRFNRARLQTKSREIQELVATDNASLDGLGHCFTPNSSYSMSQVDIALEILPSLLPDLNDEGFQLVFYHLEPLFTNQETCLYAFTHLFDILAHAMGPKVTVKKFLKPLIELYDSRSLAIYEHLTSQAFLSQIIVRFGLENFLTNFVSFVIDAVAFELMLQKKTTPPTDRVSVHSADGIQIEDEQQKEKDDKRLYPSVDEDEDDDVTNGTNAIFSDQEETADYAVHVDDVDDEISGDVGYFIKRRTGKRRTFKRPPYRERDSEEDIHKRVSDKLSGEHSRNDLGVRMEEILDGSEKESPSDDSGTDKKEQDNRMHKEGEPGEVESRKENGEGESSAGVHRGSMLDAMRDKPINKADTPSVSRAPQGSESEEAVPFPSQTSDANITSDSDIAQGAFKDEDFNGGDGRSDRELLAFDKDLEDSEDSDDEGSDDSNDAPDELDDEADESLGVNRGLEESMDSEPPPYDFYQDSSIAVDEKEKVADLTPAYVSAMAAESVMWLAPRLGPVLTSQHIAHQLLQMLPQCYVDVLGVAQYEQEDEDRKAKWVLYCLGSFCILYGEAFVMHQYLPHMQKTVTSLQTRFGARGEASLASVFALLKYCIPYMSKETLVDNFETLVKTVFQPVLRILSSWNIKFPGGGEARAALCHSYVDLLTALSMKLERELTRELMTAPLQQFFSCFALVHLKKEYRLGGASSTAVTSTAMGGNEGSQTNLLEPQGDITRPEQIEAFCKTAMYDELYLTFSPAMAHHAYVPLCGIMGGKYMETVLYNHDLIWSLCCSHDVQLSHPSFDEQESRDDDDEVQDDGKAVLVGEEGELNKGTGEGKNTGKRAKRRSGSKPRIPSWLRRTEKNKEPDTTSIGSMQVSSSDQYLKGSWLEHWKYQLNSKKSRERKSQFHLQQAKLQTFTGHSGAVRSLCIQDSEHYFLSASKDKTVKLWSLSNHGGGTAQSASSCTYYHHSRGVFAVDMVESVRQAASCDGTVHIWDPVSASTVSILELPRGSAAVAMTAMPAPSQSVVVGTSEGTVRFIDVRQRAFVQEWKTTTSNVAGSIRDICCGPDNRWVAIGFSSGLVSVLDVRGGLLRSQRRAHTSDVLQVRALSSNSLVTSSVDQGLSMWKDDGQRLKSLKGHVDPLHLLIVLKNDVISASSTNRIGLHQTGEGYDDELPYTSYKLPVEVFRGNITSLGYLPLNRLLLLGSDTGNITLCA